MDATSLATAQSAPGDVSLGIPAARIKASPSIVGKWKTKRGRIVMITLQDFSHLLLSYMFLLLFFSFLLRAPTIFHPMSFPHLTQ